MSTFQTFFLNVSLPPWLAYTGILCLLGMYLLQRYRRLQPSTKWPFGLYQFSNGKIGIEQYGSLFIYSSRAQDLSLSKWQWWWKLPMVYHVPENSKMIEISDDRIVIYQPCGYIIYVLSTVEKSFQAFHISEQLENLKMPVFVRSRRRLDFWLDRVSDYIWHVSPVGVHSAEVAFSWCRRPELGTEYHYIWNVDTNQTSYAVAASSNTSRYVHHEWTGKMTYQSWTLRNGQLRVNYEKDDGEEDVLEVTSRQGKLIDYKTIKKSQEIYYLNDAQLIIVNHLLHSVDIWDLHQDKLRKLQQLSFYIPSSVRSIRFLEGGFMCCCQVVASKNPLYEYRYILHPSLIDARVIIEYLCYPFSGQSPLFILPLVLLSLVIEYLDIYDDKKPPNPWVGWKGSKLEKK